MNNRLKETFDNIYAETELKVQTKEFIAHKIENYKPQRKRLYKRMIPAIACCLFLLFGFGGYRAYFTETLIISIDINPSIELNVNRFDRVIAINSYNDDGLKLADSIDIRHMNYMSALDKILNADSVSMYLSQDEMLSISVVGQDKKACKKMLANIEGSVLNHRNVCCGMGNFEEIDEAHSSGLSVGKYQAFLELQEVDPDVTIEDVKGLSMRQIRDLIDGSSGSGSDDPACDGNEGDNEGNGRRKGHGHRHGGCKRSE